MRQIAGCLSPLILLMTVSVHHEPNRPVESDQIQKRYKGLTEKQMSRYQKYQSDTNHFKDYEALRELLVKEAPINNDIVWAHIARRQAIGPGNNPIAVRLILLAGLSPNTRVPDEYYRDLPVFITSNDKEIIELFAIAGADFNLMSGDGSITIIHSIAMDGNAMNGGLLLTNEDISKSLAYLFKIGVPLNRKNGKGQTVRERLTWFEPGVGGGVGIKPKLKELLDKYGID